MQRVEWTEDRSAADGDLGVRFHILAESRDGKGWQFSEREVGEVRWFSVRSTSALLHRVAKELANTRPLAGHSLPTQRIITSGQPISGKRIARGILEQLESQLPHWRGKDWRKK